MAKAGSGKVVRYGPYPEFSVAGIAVGYVIGVLICASMGYASLMLGFAMEGSEIAAILGFGILRGLLRRNSIIENNINQTLASSISAVAGGVMFTVPAIFILQQFDFNPYLLTVGCIAGGLLGISFIIPLRKQMIDFERLAYPQGVATAVILKSPGAGVRKAVLFTVGILLSAAVHVMVLTAHYENFPLGEILGLPPYLNLVFYISLMTIGIGYISGSYAIFFVIGGFFCYFVLGPILVHFGAIPGPEELQQMGTSALGYLRLSLFRPLGIGMLIGGAFGGILLAIPLIKTAIQSMHRASKMKKGIAKDEMPIKFLYYGVVLSFLVLCVVAVYSKPEITWLRGVAMGLLGTVWIWLAGVIVAESLGRTSWNPLSGMTLVAVTILVFICSGMSDSATIIASVTVGAAACVSLALAGDMMMDLKAGFLVGAIPRRQQIAQYLGVWVGPIVLMGVIFVLHKAYGLGGDKFPAPQAQALASTIKGIIGGNVPVAKYLSGAGLGAILSLGAFGAAGVVIGLGFYMPFNIVLTYTIGMVVRLVSDKKLGHKFAHDTGIPLAAGLVVGEALVGMGYALFYVFKGIGGAI